MASPNARAVIWGGRGTRECERSAGSMVPVHTPTVHETAIPRGIPHTVPLSRPNKTYHTPTAIDENIGRQKGKVLLRLAGRPSDRRELEATAREKNRASPVSWTDTRSSAAPRVVAHSGLSGLRQSKQLGFNVASRLAHTPVGSKPPAEYNPAVPKNTIAHVCARALILDEPNPVRYI